MKAPKRYGLGGTTDKPSSTTSVNTNATRLSPQQWYDQNISSGHKLSTQYGQGTSYQDEISRGKYPTFYNPREYQPNGLGGGYSSVSNPDLKQGDPNYNPFITYDEPDSRASRTPIPGKAIHESNRTAINFGNDGTTTYRYNDGTVKILDPNNNEVKPIGFNHGGLVKKMSIGGFFGDALDFGKNTLLGGADLALTSLGAGNVIQDSDYSGAGSGLTKGFVNTVGGITKNILPLGLQAIGVPAPATMAAQSLIGGFNPQSDADKQAQQAQTDAISAQNKATTDAKNAYDRQNAINSATSQRNLQNYSDGGKIEGKGTAKSDSIDAKVRPGSFVVPAEKAEEAKELRKTYLSPPKRAKLNQVGGSEVKLSNGEHLFTPEEVAELKKNGIDVDDLAPHAKEALGYAEGGLTSEKAKLILKDGTIRGKKISDKQRKYFGYIAGGSK